MDKAKTVNLTSIIEELNGIASKEMNKLLKEAENFTIQCNTGRGSLMQVDVERVASSLPLHLIAVLLAPDTEMRLAYLLRGVRLLHTLSDVASRHTRLEQILLDDVKLSEQVMDLVFFMLIVLPQTEQDYGLGTSLPPLHSALVACTLHLLTGYISSQWHELVHVLLAHPKVEIFMDVAFDAVHADIRLLHIKLSALNNDILCKSCSLSFAERTANYLCQQSEASLQFLSTLCQQKLFRDRLLKNKELCRNGGILSLSLSILRLKVPDSFKESLSVVAAVSRLKSKVLSILLQLCEAESISYLDEVAGSPKSMQLAKSVALEILDLLKAAFRKDARQPRDSLDRSNPKGLVLLNSLRLADIYSDDSNFRSFFMTNAIQVLIEILAIRHEEFQPSWCSVDTPMIEEDANVEYDPFTAAGMALTFLMPDCESILLTSAQNETNFGCNNNLNGMPSVTYAQQRTSYLVKIIANLHCFVPNICEEEERNLFLNKFHECLCMEMVESLKCPSNSIAQRAAAVCKNLSALSDYAGSLIPNLLNDEDVHLFRVFTEQLKKLFPPQIGDNLIQESFLKDADVATNKADNLYPLTQMLNWNQFSNPTFSKAHRDAGNNTWGAASTILGRLDVSAEEEASKAKGTHIGMGGGVPGSSVREELDQHIVTSKPLDLTDSFEQSRRKNTTATTRGMAESFRCIEKENQNFETKGVEQSSCNGDHDLISDSGEPYKLGEYGRENGFQENEKVEGVQGEEKQPRKRKRNIMSERQIILIEKALLDEPEMQRNSALLQSWADRLSAQGSEITPSQLKNWLNNRKARLARAAREARATSEGENGYPGPQFYDSPDSAGEELYLPSTRTGSLGPQSTARPGRPSGEDREIVPRSDFMDFSSQHGAQMNRCSSRAAELKPGLSVMVVDGEGKEVGRGKVFQVDGRWQGKSLADVGVCIVDIAELKVERWMEIQHPSEGGGRTFEEAAARNGGIARVAWNVVGVHQLPQ